MPENEGTGTVSTKSPTLTLGYLMLVLALAAQGALTVELFEAGTTPGKVVAIIGIVLTGLGFNAARKAQP